MDLESESSALGPVEDNGLNGEAETSGDKLVSASTTLEADKDEKTSPPIAKGFGLMKWRRRIKRDLVKDDTYVSVEHSKVMKRASSGAADPNAKHMHSPGPDVKQDSLGSVGLVNNTAGFAIDGSSHGAGLAFSAGMNSDNSEDRTSKSSAAASGPKVRCERTLRHHSWGKQRAKCLDGKSVISCSDSGQQKKSSVGNSKKARGERIKIEKENSHSSMESANSRSSNFVFMQGASFILSSREPSGRRMMDYDKENSDHEAHTLTENVEESEIKNNGSSDSLDPLTEAFNSFHSLQEALKNELQKFQELGKEPISLQHDGAESSSCINAGHDRAGEASSFRWFGSENMSEKRLTSLDWEILNLLNNVEHLEIKLEETKRVLEVKESQIRDLESTMSVSEPRNRGTENGIGMEDIFQQKMEAEIEYLIFSRSVENLKRQIKLIEEDKAFAENQAHKTLSKLGEAESKAENLKNQAQDLQNHCVEITEIQEVKSFKKRVVKTTSCLLLQLGLLFMLFNFQLMPESEIVVPT